MIQQKENKQPIKNGQMIWTDISLKKAYKLLIINDPHDRLIHPKRFNETFPLICQAVEQLQDYYIIQIK